MAAAGANGILPCARTAIEVQNIRRPAGIPVGGCFAQPFSHTAVTRFKPYPVCAFDYLP